jgi:hypothetical protein
VLALSTGVDDTGQQGEDVGTDGGARAMADTAGDDPMAQGLLGGVVGQRLLGVLAHAEHGVPVVEERDRQGLGLVMAMPEEGDDRLAQPLQVLGLGARQSNRRAVGWRAPTGGVDRDIKASSVVRTK